MRKRVQRPARVQAWSTLHRQLVLAVAAERVTAREAAEVKLGLRVAPEWLDAKVG